MFSNSFIARYNFLHEICKIKHNYIILRRNMTIFRQRFCKHRLKAGTATEVEVHLLGNGSLVPVATDNTEQHRNRMRRWSIFETLWSYKRVVIHSRVEAGSNTSTVTLRYVGGDEKGILETETAKYDHEYNGTQTRKWLRWRGPAAFVNDIPVLSSESAPQINEPETVRQ
jgi:hypothetical protein